MLIRAALVIPLIMCALLVIALVPLTGPPFARGSLTTNERANARDAAAVPVWLRMGQRRVRILVLGLTAAAWLAAVLPSSWAARIA